MAQNRLFPLIVIPTVLLYLMLLVFSGAALIIRETQLWKRLIPLAVFVLNLAIPIVIATIAFISVSVSSNNNPIYDFAREATIPQWFLFGTISWILLGIVAFLKNVKAVEDKIVSPPKPPEFA